MRVKRINFPTGPRETLNRVLKVVFVMKSLHAPMMDLVSEKPDLILSSETLALEAPNLFSKKL